MWQQVIDFLNSNFFIALVTGLSATVAILLYNKQKNESKQRAAILLINEIRNAEAAIGLVKDTLTQNPGASLPEITVLPENSWNKFSNLFTKDFDQDQIRLINKFYSDAERVNYIVTQSNNMFLVNVLNRASAIQHANVNLLANAKHKANVVKLIAEFEERLWRRDASPSIYTPQGFTDQLNKYLIDIQFLLSTPVGEKFKKIAKLK